MSEMQKQF